MGGSLGWCASRLARFRSVVGLLVIAAAGCGATDVPDLASNERLFPPSRYVAKLPADRAAFVAPLVDARKVWVADAAASAFPTRAMPEGVWARPLPEMLDEVVRKEIAESRIVSSVSTRAEPQGLIVKPSLVVGAAAVQELPQGRRTIAEAALRIVVLGPDDGTGKRASLHDQVYTNRQLSEVEMRPPSAIGLLSRCLRLSLSQAIASLDQANVARAGVPLSAPDQEK